MKSIKLFFAFLISTTVLLSCGTNKPDNIAHGTDVVQNGFKPGPTPKDPVQPVYDTTVLIKPTWGQANHYASERGDFLIWQIIGWVLLVGAVVVVYSKATEASWLPKINPLFFGALLFVLLAGALTSLKWQSSSIKWNNDKWIPKAQFDRAIHETKTTQPVWDSLRKDCKIVFGPYDCYKK